MSWIFGPAFEGHPDKVDLAQLKKLSVPERAKAFAARTQAFFLDQVDTISSRSPWAPFPLAVMTCVGIEMIGSYKYGDAFGDSNRHFRKFVEDISPRFAEIRLDPDDRERPLSDFIYEGFRNSLSHGFYGKWVFISHKREEVATVRYNSKKRLVLVNVYWLYQQFKKACQLYLNDLASATESDALPLSTFNRTFEKNFALWLK
jgi:hypothetical protein